jgi:subtilisin family serine protease
MKQRALAFAVWVCAGFSCAVPALAGEDDEVRVPNQFVIRLAPGASAPEVAASVGGGVLRSDSARNLHLISSSPLLDDDLVAQILDADARCLESEYQRRLSVPEAVTQSFFLTSSAPAFDAQREGLPLGIPAAHAVTVGNGVVVAVLDTGVSPHARLAGRLLPGFNFIALSADTGDTGDGLDNNGNGTTDEGVGHGTMVAGLVHQLAPGAAILPVTVLNSDGVGDTFAIAQGVYFAIERGARVVNMSFACPERAGIIEDAINDARAAGVTVVSAAGNTGNERQVFPAEAPGVIGVAALAADGVRADFSDFGEYVDISAPGVELVSLMPVSLGGDDARYASASGTSFATALTSGVAALVKSRLPGAGPARVREMLEASASSIAAQNPGFGGLLGAGRIHAGGAVAAAACRADFDLNGRIDPDDLSDFITAYFGVFAGLPDARADFDGDGVTNPDDLATFIAVYFDLTLGCAR